MAKKTEVLFFNNFVREDFSKADRVWKVVNPCTTLNQTRNAIVNLGFELVETNQQHTTIYRYADNNHTIIETYYNSNFQFPLTVSVSEHSFDNVQQLLRYYDSWDNM